MNQNKRKNWVKPLAAMNTESAVPVRCNESASMTPGKWVKKPIAAIVSGPSPPQLPKLVTNQNNTPSKAAATTAAITADFFVVTCVYAA